MAQPDPPADLDPGHPKQAPLPEQVQVGTVAGTHGNDGRLRIEPTTDNPDRFRTGARLVIGGTRYAVDRTTRGQSGQLLVKLEGVDTREAAAELAREQVVVPAGDVPTPPADTYYHFQLLDMTVTDAAGAVLGRLTEVISTGANDVYVVTGPERELLVPALADVVIAVDVAAGRMTVALPEGLEPRPLRSVDAAAKPKQRPQRRPKARRPRAL